MRERIATSWPRAACATTAQRQHRADTLAFAPAEMPCSSAADRIGCALSPDQLRHLRAALGLSQTELGNRLEVSQATISLWENGHQEPANDHVERIRDLTDERGVDLEVEPAGAAGDEEPLLFGDWLSRERTLQGLTRRELADRSDVSYQQIRNLEIGESENPQERTRRALEDALGTDTPEAVEEATDEESEIEDVGKFISFDPHDEDSYPEEPGIYVFYDIADHVLYVGESGNIRKRIRHYRDDYFWFHRRLVTSASYVRIENEPLRKQIERTMIKFLKSNAIFNKHHVERGD